LPDGEAVSVNRGLIRASSTVVKVATMVKNIRLTEGDSDFALGIEDFGSTPLTPKFIKKASTCSKSEPMCASEHSAETQVTTILCARKH
jgi:hypothetical protein